MSDTAIDEGSFTAARTVGDLTRPSGPVEVEAPLEFPAWNRSWWARGIRRVVQAFLSRPLTRYYARITVAGTENLRGPQGAGDLCAQSSRLTMDVPAVLCALPPEWRAKVAPAMAKEWFEPHFHPRRFSAWRRFTSGLQYYSAALFYNAFPIPQREMGARRTLRYMGSLMDQGWCVLIFPEGDRTRSRRAAAVSPGHAMLASQTRVAVVPVRLEGLERVFHRGARWPSHGPVRVTFGAPLTMEGDDYAAETRRLEQAVSGFSPSRTNLPSRLNPARRIRAESGRRARRLLRRHFFDAPRSFLFRQPAGCSSCPVKGHRETVAPHRGPVAPGAAPARSGPG